MGSVFNMFKSEDNQASETINFVWLDDSINDDPENKHIQEQLRRVISNLQTFTDGSQCVDYIRSCPGNIRIVLIVNGRLGREWVPHIHEMKQIISIYVYCMNKKRNEEWAKDFSKIKSVTVHSDELINLLRSEDISQNPSPTVESDSNNVLSSSGGQSQLIVGLNDFHFYSQLLIDCLLRMEWTPADKDEFISECQKILDKNDYQQAILHEFQENYAPTHAIQWYTRDSFLYRMMNTALNNLDIDQLFHFRFLMRDILQQLEQNKYASPVRLYRGQVMSNEGLQMLENAIGKCISLNSFLFPSLDRDQVLANLSNFEASTNNSPRVLFEIDADPRVEGVKPFASLSSCCSLPDQTEVLIMLGAVIRIDEIQREENGVWIVRAALCSDNDDNLKPIFNQIKSRYYPEDGHTDLLTFSQILFDMDKFDAAEKYIRRQLNSLSDGHSDMIICYDLLGNISLAKGNFESSLDWHQKSLAIKLSTNDPSLVDTYNNIAIVYQRQGNYPQALEFFQKALTIWKPLVNEDDPSLVHYYSSMASICQADEKHTDALCYYHKTLAILLKHVPADHADLAAPYNNIANVYACLGHHDIALGHYQMALKIKLQCLSSHDPSIGKTFENMGIIFQAKHDFQQALECFEKAATIYRQTFPSTHGNVIQIEEHIRYVSSQFLIT